MKVTISLDFDDLKEEIKNEMCNRLLSLGYSEDQIDVLERSFEEDIDGGFMDATFEIEMDDEEKEVTACMFIGG